MNLTMGIHKDDNLHPCNKKFGSDNFCVFYISLMWSATSLLKMLQ